MKNDKKKLRQAFMNLYICKYTHIYRYIDKYTYMHTHSTQAHIYPHFYAAHRERERE